MPGRRLSPPWIGKRRFAYALIALVAFAGAAFADTLTVSPVPAMPDSTRGQSVQIKGTFPGDQDVKVYLRSGKESAGDKGFELPGVVNDDHTAVTFKLPLKMDTGTYLVFLDSGTTEVPVPGELRVNPDADDKVAIDAISPATDYKNDTYGGYEFTISGTNLARQANDNVLEQVGVGPVTIGSDAECADYKANHDYKKVCLSYEPGMEGQRLTVTGFHPRRYEGPVRFAIKVGNNLSNSQSVIFSGMRAENLRLMAIGVFLILAGIVFFLVWRGIKEAAAAGQGCGPLAAFFLDRETNSFSLSKFQLLAWTSTAVFGYVYLFICRMLIQWNFTFPPVPDNLPTLLGVSAGTTVAAVGITVNRGSKGSGPVHPSLADFISTGGLVASDRFQFFIWTLVGCLGFLSLILSADPSSLTDLPNVPGAFLTLMGVSSAGYLAGKLVRLPGPIIKLLTVSNVVPGVGKVPPQMVIRLKGENLSSSAGVKIGNDALRMDQYTLAGITPQDQPANPTFCSEVQLILTDATKYLEGAFQLILINGDGQSAACIFPMDPMTLDPVPTLTAGAVAVPLQVTGNNFSDGTTVEWTDAAGVPVTLPAADITHVSANELQIKLIPGPAGHGKLLLQSRIGLQASRPVDIHG